MSEYQPPSGTPEYLEHSAGAPLAPEPPAPSDPAGAGRRKSRRTWWVGGGAVVLLGLGAGAWAAVSFFQQGAQPAEALPSSTVAYVALDLDPSGGQKIDAFKTLDKFPAYKKDVGVDSVDQLRQKIGDSLISDSGCSSLDFSRDIDPWLGDRIALAVVPVDGKPQVAGVVQVKDEDKARTGLGKIAACTDSQDAGYVVKNGWATLAQTQKIADAVSSATADGTLADDATYQKWTKAVGDAGVVNAYASPDAGRTLAKEMGSLLGGGMFAMPGETQGYSLEGSASASAVPSAFHATTAGDATDPFTQALSGFKGGAATLRFTGDGLELAVAGDGSSAALSGLTGTTGGDLVRRLPDDTAAAIGITFPKDWLETRLKAMSGVGGMSEQDLEQQLSQATGLTVPDDIDTLLGSGVALSVSKDIDFEAIANAPDATGIPVAATVQGDATAIGGVLDKLKLTLPQETFFDHDSSGGIVAVGPSSDYRKTVLAGGHLGDDSTFTSVVPDAADASSIFYVNVDDLEPAIAKTAGESDQQDLANLKPLRAVGFSTWDDGGVVRFSLKVSTN